jgi:prepilin-type N-terminal cleavage/methylation domain-containing protein
LVERIAILVRRLRALGSPSGFTLLEQLLVIALVVVVSAIALPNLFTVNRSYRLSSASSAVVTKVHQARANALKRNRPTWVLIDGAAGTVRVITSTAGGGTEDVGAIDYIPSGVSFGTGAAQATLTFDSMGRPLNPPQTIQLLIAGSGLTRTITVSSTGRITVS